MDYNVYEKVGNSKQLISAYDFEIKNGLGAGKRIVLVNNNLLEVAFNADNALDIAWLKYKGVNVSFLSKNGLNNNNPPFGAQFEGGFLYTCGLDNVSACEKDKAIHGSLHSRKADNLSINTYEDTVVISADVYTTMLKGINLVLHREYTVTENCVSINDTVINKGFEDADYVLLYHVNFGYPFLDEGLKLEFDAVNSYPANPHTNVDDCKIITGALKKDTENLYYHYLKNGTVNLTNEKLGMHCQFDFDMTALPLLVQWKNLFKGDYVLGIEPATTRFEEYKKNPIKSGERHGFNLSLKFS